MECFECSYEIPASADRVPRLEQATQEAQALDVAFILLDGKLSEDCRKKAASELNQLLEADETRASLDRVFRARPFPAESDVAGALRCSKAAGALSTFIFLETLRVLQPFISSAFAAWESIPAAVVPVEKRKAWTAILIREGVFNSLVQTLAAGGSLGKMYESAGMIVAGQIPEWDEVHPVWKDQVKLHARGGITRVSLEHIYGAMGDVIREMQRQDWPAAREKVAELVSEEIAGGDVIGAVKSLGQLAKKAQDRGFCGFQGELTTEAVNLGPFSAKAWTQHGKMLFDAGDVAGALYAYDRALALESDVVVKTGRAKVLKARGNHDEALRAYESALAQHPDDVIAKTGRAEVLKAQGNYDEALRAYELTITQHPDDVVAKNGRVGVLIALRRFDEASASLPDAFPGTAAHWIGLHIRGMIHLRMGKLDEAARIFEEGLRESLPRNRDYFRSALAVTRLYHRQYDTARSLLYDVKTPELQAVANVLLTHAFGALGDDVHAREAYLLIPEKGPVLLMKIRDELRRRFVDHLPATWQEHELIDHEVEFLMAA